MNANFNSCQLSSKWFSCVFFFTIQTNFPEMMNRYKQLLTYIRSAVTRNYSEKSINSILDYISTSKQVCIRNAAEFLGSNSGNCFEVAFDYTTTKTMFLVLQMDLLQEFYETTLDALKDAKNDRLWFKTNTKVHRSAELIYSISGSQCTWAEAQKWSIGFFHTVGEAVPGERRIWKIAKDP